MTDETVAALFARHTAGGGYQIIADPEVFAATAAAFLARKLGGPGVHGEVSIALSGGSTPRPVYRALARDPTVAWPRLQVFFADERVVPFDDPASNYRLARETLLDHVSIAPGRIHAMPAEAEDVSAAAADYGRRLPERLDLLILGIGEDGHTASLFPGSDALTTSRRVTVSRAPVAPYDRITITPAVIASARLVVVLVAGRRKAPALARALAHAGDTRDCPARLARGGIWILGRDAVDGLTSNGATRA
ncbi:MAG: 6-phosphogluconolactonase [Gemmatimonadetes bacterium]|nr:6-phosphogluconolactonase [Gemmatimonadota bacterium]